VKRKVVLAYLFIAAFFTVIFLGLFRTPLFGNQKVLFYRGNLLLVIAFLLTALVLYLVRNRSKVRFETALAALVLSASLHLAFFVTFPVTFDRSVTMYLLNRLESSKTAQCAGLSEQEMEQVFIKEYVKERQAMRRRIKEQSIINMLKESNQCVTLTPRGASFLRFSETVMRLYNLR